MPAASGRSDRLDLVALGSARLRPGHAGQLNLKNNSAIPFLPGFTSGLDSTKGSFKKTQTLSYGPGGAVASGPKTMPKLELKALEG